MLICASSIPHQVVATPEEIENGRVGEALLVWKDIHENLSDQQHRYENPGTAEVNTKPISPQNEERALMFIQGAAFQAQKELDGEDISGMKYGFHDASGICPSIYFYLFHAFMKTSSLRIFIHFYRCKG